MAAKPTYNELAKKIQELERAESERKRTEKTIKEQARLLDLIFEHSLENIVLLDNDYNFIRVSESYAKACQKDSSEFPGHNHFDLYPSSLKDEFDDAKKGKYIYRRSARPFVFPDHPEWGTTYWDLGLVPILDNKGEIELFLFTLKDITNRKRAEEALRESDESLRAILAASPGPMVRYDSNGVPLYINPAFTDVFGWTLEELKGCRIPFVPENQKKITTAAIQEMYRCGATSKFETQRYTKDGRTIDVIVSAAAFKGPDNIPAGMVVNLTDITERKRTEEALKESEAHLRTLIRTIPDLIWLKDPQGVYLFCNPRFENFFGAKEKEIIGKTDYDFVDRELADFFRNNDEMAIARGEPIKNEEEVIFACDGHREILETIKTPMYRRDGRLAGVLGIGRDFTARKQAEIARREHIQFLEGLGEINRVIHSSTDPDQMLKKAIETVFNLFDCDRAWLLHPCDPHAPTFRIPIETTRPEYPGAKHLGMDIPTTSPMQDDMRAALEADGPVACGPGNEKPLSADTHKNFNVQAQLFMSIHPKIGRPWIFGMHQCSRPRIWKNQEKGLFNEIGRRIADGLSSLLYLRALKSSENKFRTIFESSRDAFLLIDPERGFLDCNPVALKMFAASSKKEFHLLTPADLSPEYQPDGSPSATLAQKKIDKALEGGINYFEWLHKGRDGREFPATVLVTRMELDGKTILHAAIRDITESKRVAEEKKLLEEQYHQAQKVESIGRLAGGVAHDLNNLLIPILGYSEMLLYNFGPNDSRKQHVEQIVQAGFRARDLVHQLLAFGRKQPLEYQPVDMNQAITGFEKLLRRTIREDIEVEMLLSPDIQIVMADIGQIEQVIMNLAVNAADALPEGGRLTIETASTALDEEYAAIHQDVNPGKYVMLAVSDTGCGMDAEIQNHIYEPFFSTKGKQGTGLGLSTVYGIVKQHRGHIWVYSEPDKGTTFKVYLPVSGVSASKKGTGKKTPSGLKGSETILVVEDNEAVRDISHAALKHHGYTILVAENGAQALELLASHDGPVDLLLTDVIMPGMNGKELFARAAERNPGLKVLYMSGYTDNVIVHQGILDEGVQFIQKPFTVHNLTTKVRDVLEPD